MENKKSLSEEDIKLQYITPALNGAGWDNQHMRMEYAFTDGRIIFQGQSSHARKAKKYADYLLQAEPCATIVWAILVFQLIVDETEINKFINKTIFIVLRNEHVVKNCVLTKLDFLLCIEHR